MRGTCVCARGEGAEGKVSLVYVCGEGRGGVRGEKGRRASEHAVGKGGEGVGGPMSVVDWW